MLKDLAEAIRRWTEKNVETKSFVATVVRANVRECNNPTPHLRFLRNKPVGTLHYPTGAKTKSESALPSALSNLSF